MMTRKSLAVAASVCLSASALPACPKNTGSAGPEVTGSGTSSAHKPKPRGGGPSVHSEVGALDQDAVQALVKTSLPAVGRCVDARRKQLPYLGGSIDAVIRSDSQGKVRWAHLSDSTLGDRDAEQCILDALTANTWPRPEGGDDGETRQHIDLGQTDVRQPAAWGVTELESAGEKLESALGDCLRASGTSMLTVTFYLDPSGSARSVGVASGDEKGISAVDCAVRAVKARTYPTPGSYPAKVSVQVR